MLFFFYSHLFPRSLVSKSLKTRPKHLQLEGHHRKSSCHKYPLLPPFVIFQQRILYKNYKNVANLVLHGVDFGIGAEWHFTATAHGKSLCDAMSAIVKRQTRLESLKIGKVIRNPVQMYNFCTNHWKDSDTLVFIFVTKEEIATELPALEKRYARANRIAGIQQCHSFIPKGENSVEVRRFSGSKTCNTVVVFEIQDEPPLPAFTVGSYVAVRISDKYQIGITEGVNEDAQLLSVSFMARSGNKNSFSWPTVPNIQEVPYRDLLEYIQPPSTTSTARFYNMNSSEFKSLNERVSVVRRRT